MLQLHGKETVARMRDIKQKFGLPVMKAMPVETAADLAPLPGYAAVADRILFDARAPKDATRPGGLGARVRLASAGKSRSQTAVHGLGRPHMPAMSRRPFASPRAGGVDVSSGVSARPASRIPR